MRNISLYMVLAFAAAALASCTKAPVAADGGFPEDGIVRISASVYSPDTKAPGTRFETAAPTMYGGSTLGLFLDYGDGQKYTRSNVLWNNDGSNNWTAAAPMLWKDASTSLGVYAYAPYVAGEDDPNQVRFTIPLDQSEGLDAADLLWCPMQGFDPATGLIDKKLNIEFKHALVKLTVNIALGTEFKGKDISIREALFRRSVDKAAIYFRGISGATESVVGVAPDVSANAVSIKMHDCSADGKLACEVIFYPHGFFDGNEMLTFTLSDGKDYRLIPASGFDGKFKPGNAYQMNLKVGNDKVEIARVNIEDWGGTSTVGGDGADFEAVKLVNISDLRTLLSEWNAENPSAKKSLADFMTPELFDECCVNGKLILTGEFDNSEPLSNESDGMSKETLEAFAVIAAYVRDNDVTCLDMSGLKGVKSLAEVRPGAEEVYNLRFSTVVREYDGSGGVTESGAGSRLVTFIGSGDVVNITSAFEKCAGLVSVSGLENVTNADFAFANCSKLSKTPDLPNVLSLNHTFFNTSITELKYKSVKEIAVHNCRELTIIDCPNVVRLGQHAFYFLPKLTELRLASKFFESVHYQAFDGIGGGQITLYLDAGQKNNINTADKTWTPKKSSGESAVEGNIPASFERFKAVYCGTDKVL